MKENLIFNNGFLFLKVVSKQHASYSTKNISEKMWFGTVRFHAGIGG